MGVLPVGMCVCLGPNSKFIKYIYGDVAYIKLKDIKRRVQYNKNVGNCDPRGGIGLAGVGES